MKFLKGPFLKRSLTLALMLGIICSPGNHSYAQASQIMKLKANFVNIFVNYVQSSGSGKTICVTGDSELLGALKASAKKASVVEVTDPGLANCTVVFIGKGTSNGDLVKNADKRSVVTVSDKSGFIGQGGLVELYEKEGKIKFALNLKKAAVVKVKFDSKLVELADKTL